MAKDKPWHRLVAGNYLGRPYDVMDSEAYRSASFRAKAVLDAIQRSFNGFNNGRIAVSRDEIARRIGSFNHVANRHAIGELVARGLLTLEKTYPSGSRKASEYRLTYISTGDSKNEISATRDYLKWKLGDAGTGNKRRLNTEPRKHSHRSIIEQDGKLSGSVIEPYEHLNGHSSGSVIEQHIDYQDRAPAAPPSEDRERGERLRQEIKRPQSVTEDRWIMAGKRAAENPAGPDPEGLRTRTAEHVERYGRGAQTRLASTAGILGGTLSKFLKGDVDMTNRHRVALACAMLKAEAQEQKLQPRRALESQRSEVGQ